jgi:hypothetical protein
VSAARECSWSASVDGGWLSIKSGATGQGEGTVEYAAASNPDPAVRRGAVVLNEQRVEVTQAAAECSYALGRTSATLSQSGGSGEIDLQASSALCGWTAQSDVDWIAIRGATSGKGSTRLAFDVAGTSGPSRSGSISIAGHRFTVTQSAGCNYSIAPASHNAPSAGSNGSIAVNTGEGCSWTVDGHASWLTLSREGGVGPESISFAVAANTGGQRSTTATVAGETFTVTQAAGSSGPAPPGPPTPPTCTYVVQPRTHSVGAGGGTISSTVGAGASCAWSASSGVGWITVNGAASGSGDGSVTLAVAPTQGAARSGVVTIANQTVTVTQAAGCTYSISPESKNMDATGGTVDVSVSTAQGCSWTASSNTSWISVREQGNSTVQVTVLPNIGAARSGTATIAGKTFTVTQSALLPSCQYSVEPTEREVNSKDRVIEIDVRTSDTCAWIATSNVSWMRVISGSPGLGRGEVRIYVAENRGDRREGTVTVAGQTVQIKQREDDN